MLPIEIHQQLSETCNDGFMDVKCVRSWVRHFKETRTSCENKPKEPRPRNSRSEDLIARMEQIFMEDRRLSVKQIAANVGISVGSVYAILHDDFGNAGSFCEIGVAMCQAMLSRDKGMNSAFFSSLSQWMRHGCRCSILKPNGSWLIGSTPTHHHRKIFGLQPVLRK